MFLKSLLLYQLVSVTKFMSIRPSVKFLFIKPIWGVKPEPGGGRFRGVGALKAAWKGGKRRTMVFSIC